MAILRQNDDDKNKDDKKAAAPAKDKQGGTEGDSASRKLGRAQNLAAAGADDDYDWTKPHSEDTPKFLGGTVAKVNADGDIVMSDHLAKGEMLRSAHEEEHKRYEGRSADL